MTEPTITQAKRWMGSLPRDQFDMLILILREREKAVIAELRAEVEDMLRDAFTEGATAVHDAWIAGNQSSDPDFTEAAYDYARAALSQKETNYDD